MSDRPGILISGQRLYWSARTVNSSGVVTAPDNSMSLRIWKNGVEQPNESHDDEDYTRSSPAPGFWDFEYEPTGIEEGDVFTFQESATMSGVEYLRVWHCVVIAPSNTATILAAISNGGTVVNNVLPGGIISLVKGDAHTKAAGNAIELVQDDADSSLFDRIKHADVTELACGFRQPEGSPSEFIGTIDPDDVTHDAELGKTTILIEVDVDQTKDRVTEKWQYDIGILIDTDKPVVLISGDATLRNRNVKLPA